MNKFPTQILYICKLILQNLQPWAHVVNPAFSVTKHSQFGHNHGMDRQIAEQWFKTGPVFSLSNNILKIGLPGIQGDRNRSANASRSLASLPHIPLRLSLRGCQTGPPASVLCPSKHLHSKPEMRTIITVVSFTTPTDCQVFSFFIPDTIVLVFKLINMISITPKEWI